MQTQPYKQSGRLGSLLIVWPLMAVPAVLILSLIYAYADVYINFVKIKGLLTMGFGALVGATMLGVQRFSKCRNTYALLGASLATGLFAVYASWAFFMVALHARFGNVQTSFLIFAETLASPGFVFQLAADLNESGWFTEHGHTEPTAGTMLLLFWIGEALIIVGFAVGIPYTLLGDSVYCERCQRWCEEQNDLALLQLPAAAQTSQIKSGDLQPLMELPPVGKLDPHLLIQGRRCVRCDMTATFRVKECVPTRDGNGNVQTKTATLINHRVASLEDSALLLDRIAGLRPKRHPAAG